MRSRGLEIEKKIEFLESLAGNVIMIYFILYVEINCKFVPPFLIYYRSFFTSVNPQN